MINACLIEKGLILFGVFLAFACTNEKRDIKYLIKSEQIVDSIYSNTFNSPVELDTNPDPVKLYKSIEDYYIFIGLLNSRDKEGYKSMINTLFCSRHSIELTCLYSNYPEIQLLTLASNVAVNHYGFEIAIKEYKEVLPINSSIVLGYENLRKITDGIHINFDKKAFIEYINSIESSDFENKIIYRIPVLAFSHVFLVEGDYK